MVKLNDLYDCMERDDILFIENSRGKLTSFSIMDNDKNCTIIMNKNKNSTQSLKKERLAHEIGHCETGAFYTSKTLNLRSRCEYRANKWAIKKLIPIDELIEIFEKGMTDIWQVAEHFEVTEDFAKKACKFYGYYNEAI